MRNPINTWRRRKQQRNRLDTYPWTDSHAVEFNTNPPAGLSLTQIVNVDDCCDKHGYWHTHPQTGRQVLHAPWAPIREKDYQ